MHRFRTYFLPFEKIPYLIVITLYFFLSAAPAGSSVLHSLYTQCLPESCSCTGNITIYTGLVDGVSKEIVFKNSGNSVDSAKNCLSKLKWEIKNLWVLGGVVQTNCFCKGLCLTVNGWAKNRSSSSVMVDKDFLRKNSTKVTHISKSPDTRLTEAYLIDAELGYEYPLSITSTCTLTPAFSLGYEYVHLFWKCYGGSFVYHENSITYRGNFPSGLVCSYKERFSIPYVGFRLTGSWKGFECTCYGKYTNKARASTSDFHALRTILFKDTFQNGEYWMAGGQISKNIWCFLNTNIVLTVDYCYQQFDTCRGNTVMHDHKKSLTKHYNNVAGIFHFHRTLKLGLRADF